MRILWRKIHFIFVLSCSMHCDSINSLLESVLLKTLTYSGNIKGRFCVLLFALAKFLEKASLVNYFNCTRPYFHRLCYVLLFVLQSRGCRGCHCGNTIDKCADPCLISSRGLNV